MSDKKLVLIDAFALAYKGYFAFITRPLKTKSGEPTSAVFGFMNQLLKVLEDIKPDYIAVAFDGKEKTFRHEMYDQYKAQRAEMPEDMPQQIDRIREVLNALNIPVYLTEGFEADDLIGTISNRAGKLGYKVFMVSPDKDYVQLINENVYLLRPGYKGEDFDILDIEAAEKKYGFPPRFMQDYLALIGDTSDNVPGVQGIGEKTAAPLIKDYQTIENLYENIENLTSNSVKNKLLNGKDSAFLSKELVTINVDVTVDFDYERAKIGNVDFESLKKVFFELEFRSLYSRILKYLGVSEESETLSQPERTEDDLKKFDPEKVKYHLVTSKEDSIKLAGILSNSKLFVFDTETDSLDTLTANIVGASFSMKPGEAYFVAINRETSGSDLFSTVIDDRLPLKDFIEIFKPVFENETVKKVCQNGKFDVSILRSLGINVRNFFFDTMIASYVLDPDQKHGMDSLSEMYLNYTPISIKEIIGAKKDSSKMFEVPLTNLSNYACEDADITFRLYEILIEQIKSEKLENLCFNIEVPLVEVLEDMERTGIKVDTKLLASVSRDLDILMVEFSRNIFNLAGEEFNISSPLQMQKILFDKLGLTSGKKTKTGFSTDAQTLESLRGSHEIIDYILNFRQASKLKSTYADSLPGMINPKTGRIHTSYNQTVASTGRLSSNDPNLQNIPIRTEIGKEIRKAFIPTDLNHVLLSADYSQIELRIMASICEDPYLAEAFRKGEDIHRSTAALVFMVDPSEVTPDMRRKAKEVNFGILYGIGPFGLKTRLGITQQHAKEIIETYFNTFTKVKEYMDKSIEIAKSKGFAETLTGRRRFLRNINNKNFAVRQFEERAAINMPIQGTAADMIKIAMINIYKELNKRKLKSKMLLQVHDELLFDVPKEEIEEVRGLVKELMISALPLNVPVAVDSGIGENWLDAH
ncbi:MAG: DNA polymerase I [Ignavibacteriaceae bacterium]|nr:DNA polymerase I [Ignavibacteriaceae bacterium]